MSTEGNSADVENCNVRKSRRLALKAMLSKHNAAENVKVKNNVFKSLDDYLITRNVHQDKRLSLGVSIHLGNNDLPSENKINGCKKIVSPLAKSSNPLNDLNVGEPTKGRKRTGNTLGNDVSAPKSSRLSSSDSTKCSNTKISSNSGAALSNLMSPNFKHGKVGNKQSQKVEVMLNKKVENGNVYDDSDDDSTISLEYESLTTTGHSKKGNVCLICELPGILISCTGPCQAGFHMDCVGLLDMPEEGFKCDECSSGIHKCFACKKSDGATKKCSNMHCGKFYHEACLKANPLSRLENKHWTCPLHTCLTCYLEHEEMPICYKGRMLRCVRCPTAFHTGDFCVAAGSVELAGQFIVCPNHFQPSRAVSQHHHINVAWCFFCSKGGDLIGCHSCPAAFHTLCVKDPTSKEPGWICEDCSRGRRPLYGEIVWVKLGSYRWWPCQIVHPRHIPDNVLDKPHQVGEFPVRFFGTKEYFWINRGRVFHFEAGDKGSAVKSKQILSEKFDKGLVQATDALARISQMKKERISGKIVDKDHPHFRYIKTNKPFGNVLPLRAPISSIHRCDCDVSMPNPCGSDTDCYNRIMKYECHPAVCRAGERCQNQRFVKKLYPLQLPFKTRDRGWGLRAMVSIRKGEFVNEYVGELIDEKECQRRLQWSHENGIKCFYFLTIDKDRIIDAGPKGNSTRFMNHSCDPNLETQKWFVNGDIRVGLFAIRDISEGEELTFNYNFDCLGNEKLKCLCKAKNCSGYIGLRPKPRSTLKDDRTEKQRNSRTKGNNDKSKSSLVSVVSKTSKKNQTVHDLECYRCGDPGVVLLCDRKDCPRVYHLKCVSMQEAPKGQWYCPWHYCDDCTKSSVKLCTECPNSFCNTHYENKIFEVVDRLVCWEHPDILESWKEGKLKSGWTYESLYEN